MDTTTIKEKLRDRLLRMGLIGNDGGHEHALDLLTEDVQDIIHTTLQHHDEELRKQKDAAY